MFIISTERRRRYPRVLTLRSTVRGRVTSDERESGRKQPKRSALSMVLRLEHNAQSGLRIKSVVIHQVPARKP